MGAKTEAIKIGFPPLSRSYSLLLDQEFDWIQRFFGGKSVLVKMNDYQGKNVPNATTSFARAQCTTVHKGVLNINPNFQFFGFSIIF